ncbi:uncharacterized protein LOC144945651 isoform X1 [Lampetra fluviatilis]
MPDTEHSALTARWAGHQQTAGEPERGLHTDPQPEAVQEALPKPEPSPLAKRVLQLIQHLQIKTSKNISSDSPCPIMPRRNREGEQHNVLDQMDLRVEGKEMYAKGDGAGTEPCGHARLRLDEAAALLSSMECELRRLEHSLEQQSRRCRRLGLSVEQLVLASLRGAPADVQKEHDRSAPELCELLPRLQQAEREARARRDAVARAADRGGRFRDELEAVRRQCPLVEGKMRAEAAAVGDVRHSQAQASAVLSSVLAQLQKTEARHHAVCQDADRQRRCMSEETGALQQALRELQTEVSQARSLFTAYDRKIAESKIKIEEIEKIHKAMQEQCKELNAEEAEQQMEVKKLENILRKQEREHNKLSQDCSVLQEQKQNLRLHLEIQIKALENKEQVDTKKLHHLHQENKASALELKNLRGQATKSELATDSALTETQRFLGDVAKMAAQQEQLPVTLASVQAKRSRVEAALQQAERVARMKEANLKNTVETMKRDLAREVKGKERAEAALDRGRAELKRSRAEVEGECRAAQARAAHAAERRLQMEGSTDSERQQHAHSQQTLESLQQQLGDVSLKQATMERELKEQTAGIEVALRAAKVRRDEAVTRAQRMQETALGLREELARLRPSLLVFDKLRTNTEEALNHLQSETGELRGRCEDRRAVLAALRDELSACVARSHGSRTSHAALVASRARVLGDAEAALEAELRSNSMLACQYRELQEKHLETKARTAALCEQRLRLESAVQDHEQLQLLQARMQALLMRYLRHRGLCGQASLNELQAQSWNDAQQVVEIQGDVEEALKRVVEFLRAPDESRESVERVFITAEHETSPAEGGNAESSTPLGTRDTTHADSATAFIT